MRVLLVEDAARVVAVVSLALKKDGHTVTACGDCQGALDALEGARFDLAVVDVGLPDRSGLELCKEARSAGFDLPILVLTARNGVDDRVLGLDAGADDYLGKPFATAELSARVRALLRRGPRWTDSRRTFGDVAVDRDRRLVTRAGASVPLTPREFDIVALLAWADGRVVLRDALLESVWGDATDRAAASLEVLLARIRRKLALGSPDEESIRTVRNVGYAWALARSNRT